MPLAALLGLGPEPLSAICNPDSKVAAEKRCAHWSPRHRRRERDNIRRAGLQHVYTMREIDERV